MTIRVALAAVLICCTPMMLHAQQRGGTTGGSTGGFGGSTGGFGGTSGASSGGFGGTSASSGTFGARSLGGGVSAGNSSAFGSQANRGAGGGQMGQNQIGQPGNVGQIDGNERFSRQGRAAGQFVGADSADTANMMGIMAGAQANALQGLARSMNQNNPNQNNNQQGNARAKKTVRAVRSVEFEYTAPNTATLNTELSTRLTKAKPLAAKGDIKVVMNGRTAVLTGTVANEHARDLAARLCLLEPGVSKVENQLVVPEELPANSPATSPN